MRSRRGREDRLGKSFGFFQSRWQRDTADFAGSFVFLPGRAGDVSAHHALDREHLGAAYQHRASAKLVSILANLAGVFLDIGGDHVVLHDIGKIVEPEQRNLIEDSPLVWDARRQNVIESGDAVGGNEEQLLVAHGVDVTDLAAGMKVEFGKIGLQENVIENFGAHDEILQVRSEAYSSWSKKNVNDSDHSSELRATGRLHEKY